MAGMLAARALADHFDAVTLLERDRFRKPRPPGRGCPTAGTPTPCWNAAVELSSASSRA
jgi:hypothetical protein